MDEEIPFKIGDVLTVTNEIITYGGYIIFAAGDKVTIREVLIKKGYWSRFCPDIWVKDKLIGFRLEEESGDWCPSTFNEGKSFSS